MGCCCSSKAVATDVTFVVDATVKKTIDFVTVPMNWVGVLMSDISEATTVSVCRITPSPSTLRHCTRAWLPMLQLSASAVTAPLQDGDWEFRDSTGALVQSQALESSQFMIINCILLPTRCVSDDGHPSRNSMQTTASRRRL